MTSFYSEEELRSIGLKSYGKNVLISRFARIYGAESISIGNNVRIDDFCILFKFYIFARNICCSGRIFCLHFDRSATYTFC